MLMSMLLLRGPSLLQEDKVSSRNFPCYSSLLGSLKIQARLLFECERLMWKDKLRKMVPAREAEVLWTTDINMLPCRDGMSSVREPGSAEGGLVSCWANLYECTAFA